MIDFEKLQNDKIIDTIHDLQISERVRKNTKIIDCKDLKNNDFDISLDNYFDYKNHIASFINKDYCFSIFCKTFRLYHNKYRLFFDIQKSITNKDNTYNLKDLFLMFLAYKKSK